MFTLAIIVNEYIMIGWKLLLKQIIEVLIPIYPPQIQKTSGILLKHWFLDKRLGLAKINISVSIFQFHIKK